MVYGVQDAFWSVEQQLGFAIPDAAWRALLRAAPTRATPEADLLPLDLPVEVYTPTRASRVRIAGEPATTYGRLLHADPPARRWEHGPFRIEILADSALGLPGGPVGSYVSYRLWHDGRVVFARAGVPLTAADPFSDDALREIAAHPALAEQADRTPTIRQRDFLAREHPALISALAPPPPLYPPGTRVHVRGMISSTTAAGVILGVVFDRGGVAHYTWRPDVYDLPGHPRQARRPDHVLVSPFDHVSPSLEEPDTAVDGPDGPALLTYGARVRSIDHPDLDTGTVLRLLLEDDGPIYEIRPDGAAGSTIHLPIDDVVPLAGTAWPTVDAVIDARDSDEVPLVPSEAIVTLREMTIAVDTPHGALLYNPPTVVPSLDQTLDPDSPNLTAAPSFHLQSSSDSQFRQPVFTINNETVYIIDAHHGALEVPNDVMAAAIAYPPAALARLAADLPDLHLDGAEAGLTVAALVAVHIPDLPAPPPPQQTQPPDPPIAPSPDPGMDFDL
ncbi:hypothetical protein ND748_05500 [Frankia sp. AiPs1]|uniref:hypothetical protein n=1 Tax=Frankia sp. AiPs1 TaxID=573493 RepID=UPI002044524A|nr:hypothetical protein [Frankia sp. AiPs1]MCM3921133.1 hypothetical protein [Frankia sp. AiPs1]